VCYWSLACSIETQGECSLPSLELKTSALWIDLPPVLSEVLLSEGRCPVDSAHTANHALVVLAPLFAQCEAADVATEHPLADSRHGLDRQHPARLLVFYT
jgi:ATP-dependent helicase YprA (DUF1998 family)